jgi:hypothetical protein
MQRAAIALGCVIGFLLYAPARAFQVSPPQQVQLDQPWWVSGEMGEGQLKISSDQQKGDRVSSFAMGFLGGHQLGQRARVGLKLNGWLLQAFNLNDPSVGESVSNVMGLIDVFPMPEHRLFARAGVGWASYTINRPTGTDGNGLGWEAGTGYEIPLRGHLALAPVLEYSAGGLGSAYDPVAPQTGRRYSVVEFKLAAEYRFGSHRR